MLVMPSTRLSLLMLNEILEERPLLRLLRSRTPFAFLRRRTRRARACALLGGRWRGSTGVGGNGLMRGRWFGRWLRSSGRRIRVACRCRSAGWEDTRDDLERTGLRGTFPVHCGKLRVLEDIVLGTILESVEIVVEGWGVAAFEHGILLLLVPIKGLFGTISTVLRRSRLDEFRIVIGSTSPGNLRFRQRSGRLCTGDVASITIHVVLLGTSIGRMDPEPSAGTLAFGAGRHISGNFKLGEALPNTSLVDGEDDEVLGLDVLDLGGGSVGDGEGAAFDVVDVLRVEFERVVSGTDIITGADIATRIRGVRGRGTLVASDFDKSLASSGELEVVSGMRRHVDMRSMHPPAIVAAKRALHEGILGLVCASIVEAEHRLVPGASMSNNRRGKSQGESNAR